MNKISFTDKCENQKRPFFFILASQTFGFRSNKDKKTKKKESQFKLARPINFPSNQQLYLSL